VWAAPAVSAVNAEISIRSSAGDVAASANYPETITIGAYQLLRVTGTFGGGATGTLRLRIGSFNSGSGADLWGALLHEGSSLIGYTPTATVAQSTTLRGAVINGQLLVASGDDSTTAIIREGDVQGSSDILSVRDKNDANLWSVNNNFNLVAGEARNLVFGTTTGTKIGTSTSQKIGFWNATPIVKPTVTGSRAGNAALASLLTALANAGLVTDSTTA
jgi:hypothetical protein